MAGRQTKTGKKMALANSHKNTFVRVFDESSGRHLIAMIVNGRIHIFDGNVRKMIVRCPDAPVAFELYKDQSAHWQIWVATQEGNIYRKPLLPPTSDICNEVMEMDSGNNQSIFDDLLTNKESDFTDFNVTHCKLWDDLCEISEEDRVASCGKEVIYISCAEGILAVVCVDGNETVLLIYSMSDLQPSSVNVAIRIPLPLCRSPFKMKNVCQFSKLIIVKSEDMDCLSSSQVCVPSHLFSVLFGWEMSVRSLPVVVCSMSDGSVYFHPVDLSAPSPQPSWRLLCRVDSPVINILPIKVNRTLSEKESVAAELQSALGLSAQTRSSSLMDAFLIVGASGKCCVTTAVPTLGSAVYSADHHKVVIMFTLPASVNCVCCQQNVLYTSSVSAHIQKCQLTLVRQEGREGKRWSVDVQSQHLFSASASSMWLSGEGKALICQIVNGDLIEIDSSPPEAGEGDPGSKTAPQPSLRDLLLGVDLSQASLDDLRSTHSCYNAFLQQMNIAAHLLHKSKHLHSLDSQNTPSITCKITVQSEIDFHVRKYYLLVEMTNRSGVTLTKDWSVVVMLHEATGKRNSEVSECCERVLPSTHSFPLCQELGAECSLHFRIPLAYSSVSCGIKVDVSLILRPPQIVQKEIHEHDSFSDCLFVPLGVSVVDAFHFLHLKQAGSPLSACADPQTGVERKVAELKHGGQSRCRLETRPAGQVYTISCHISAVAEGSVLSLVDTVRTLLKESQVEIEQLTHASCSLQAPCGSVLILSVEPAALPDLSTEDGQSHNHTLVMKSASISLLARARLALTRRLQVFGVNHSDVSVEEFRKMIQRTESLQQQLQEIQDKWRKGDNTAKGTLSELCTVYETIQNDTL